MMNAKVVVYGAGGHGKVVAETLAAMGMPAEGFIDDDPAVCARTVLGLVVFQAAEWLQSHPCSKAALGIGDNRARELAAAGVKRHGSFLLSAAHPSAVISNSARIGEGVVVLPGVVLNAECQVEEGAIINTGAIVEHDARIGRYAHLSPNSAVAGGTLIGAFSHVGMGASILPGVTVGENCVIGAGAVVVADIADNLLAVGMPATERKRV